MSGRLVPPLLAVLVGVGSGIYVFQPLLKSFGASTGGTFRPEDDHHSAPVPSLPFTSLQPGKTADGHDLLPPPQQDPVTPIESQQKAERKV
ncbi:hypothetical protein JCM10207_000763 [Rhodosporidiobolus poonsookiae]